MADLHPIMPHATAAWLVENTSLTFQQIADFCGIHVLEVQAIADDTASTKLTGRDPVRAGDVSMADIEKGQADPAHRLTLLKGPDQLRRTKGPRYTPVSKRADKPDGVAWIVRNYPHITDAQISKLIGTTKTTIASIREKTHWNYGNIVPKDPVALGLCSQRELDALVAKAAAASGAEPQVEPGSLEADRRALIEQLRAEREAAERAAEAALSGTEPAEGDNGAPA